MNSYSLILFSIVLFEKLSPIYTQGCGGGCPCPCKGLQGTLNIPVTLCATPMGPQPCPAPAPCDCDCACSCPCAAPCPCGAPCPPPKPSPLRGMLQIPVDLCTSPYCAPPAPAPCQAPACPCPCPAPACPCPAPCGPPMFKLTASAIMPGCCGGCSRKKRSISLLDSILSLKMFKRQAIYPDDYDYDMRPSMRMCDCPCPPAMMKTMMKMKYKNKYNNFRRAQGYFRRRMMGYY